MKAKNCQNSFITLKNKLYVHCTDILVYMQDVVLKKCWTNYTYIQVYTGESRQLELQGTMVKFER